MSEIPQGNPRIPEGINVKNEKPFAEFLQLLVAVLVAFAGLLGVIVVAVDFAVPHIPFAWEAKASPLVAQYLEQGEQPPSSEAQAALATLGAQLVSVSLALEGEKGDGSAVGVPASEYRFHLINSDVTNAYATLGGHIVVTDALLKQVTSENGLAMVVAHEIAHIRYRHPIAGASRALVLQLALYALLGGSGDGPLGGVLSGSSALALLRFNRDMEARADALALDIIERHYGTYLGADEFFDSMAKSNNESQWLEFAQTHPNSEGRLRRIRERIETTMSASHSTTPLPDPLQ